jgi:hypothetical protein
MFQLWLCKKGWGERKKNSLETNISGAKKDEVTVVAGLTEVW